MYAATRRAGVWVVAPMRGPCIRPSLAGMTATDAGSPPRHAAPVRLIGADTTVPCGDGRLRRYVNLDYAASTR